MPRISPRIPVRFEWLNREVVECTAPEEGESDPGRFHLRSDLSRLSLLQGFDELLCLSQLDGVQTYWYQVETVRKVLKQFRGRVLLADEVGLSKTIEAGMVLKEYLLRGMVERFLILTPASLVGQWKEEIATKFGLSCATSHDGLLRSDPKTFWAQPRVIASIATARRKEHFAELTRRNYDLVIVDEAHHLKNRTTRNYKLVDALQKRFLLLLSATPVQNSLVELYNLLTLLKPGIFKTEKEFRAAYMTPGKPRMPANHERMRNLMRDVMVRNTRALVPGTKTNALLQVLRRNPEEKKMVFTHHRDTLAHLTAQLGTAGIDHAVFEGGLDGPAKDAVVASFRDRVPVLLCTESGGEVGAILGEIAEEQDFSKLVFDTWVQATGGGGRKRLDHLGDTVIRAKRRYEAVKTLDDELFGDEFETA